MAPPWWSAPPAALGLYLQVLSTACFAVMSLVAKLGGGAGLPVFEIVLARSLVLLAMSTAMLARQGARAQWPWRSERRLLFLLRGVLGFGAVSCLYWAVQYLPLGDTAVLAFLTPVFVAAAAPLALGERAGKGVLAAIPLCGAGVVLVAQPELLFGGGAGALSGLGVAIGVMQAVFSAAAKLCIRSLGGTEPVSAIIYAMAAASTLGSAASCALLPAHFVVPASARQWGLLLGAGVLGCGVQVLATTALKLSKAAPVVMMSYLSVVWGMLLDLALGDRPGLLDLLGAALVCAASFVVVGLERRDGSASGGQSSVKAKDSSRTLGLGGDAHQWQRLAGEDEDGAANGAASGQQRQQPPSARQLELAEGGSAHIAAVRWGSAAEAELEGGAAKQASGAA